MVRLRTFAALTAWAYLAWLLLTWTRTAEQFLVGLGIALIVAAFLTPFGAAAGMVNVLVRLPRLVLVLLFASWRIVTANVGLARRIWAPSRPLRPGMIIVPTSADTDARLAAVGLVSSLIVDNQLVDLDRSAREMQYHGVDVDGPSPNEQLERLLP
jgi:multicomponent Na+:H+ antiporter subunit E